MPCPLLPGCGSRPYPPTMFAWYVTDGTRLRLGPAMLTAAACWVCWLVLRPDRHGPQWDEGTASVHWLALEALIALVAGLALPKRVAARGLAVGWLLQVAHFYLLGEHYDDTLWGVGVLLQVIFGALAVTAAWALASARTRLALLVHRRRRA